MIDENTKIFAKMRDLDKKLAVNTNDVLLLQHNYILT